MADSWKCRFAPKSRKAPAGFDITFLHRRPTSVSHRRWGVLNRLVQAPPEVIAAASADRLAASSGAGRPASAPTTATIQPRFLQRV